MSTDVPDQGHFEPEHLRPVPRVQVAQPVVPDTGEIAAQLRTGTAELAAAIQGWPNREIVRNSVSSIIEAAASYDFAVVDDTGDAAFQTNDALRRLEFSRPAIMSLRSASAKFAEKVRPGDVSFASDLSVLGDRLFTFHELLHVAQNAGDFGTIQHLKQLSRLQIAQLDLVADLAAVYAAACIDCARNGTTSYKFFAAAVVRTSIFSYAMGVGAFGATEQTKRARFLGLLMTAAATHALNDGKLRIPWLRDGTAVVPPILPVLQPTGEFNAIVLSPTQKVLLPRSHFVDPALAMSLCGDLRQVSVETAISSTYSILVSAGVIDSGLTTVSIGT